MEADEVGEKGARKRQRKTWLPVEEVLKSPSTFPLGDLYSEQYIWLSWRVVCKARGGRGGGHLSVNGALCLASCLPCCLPSQACRERPPLRPSCFISSFHLPSLPIHFSTTPKGQPTLTLTLCFHSLPPAPFAYVVNGGISQLIRHVYEWHGA